MKTVSRQMNILGFICGKWSYITPAENGSFLSWIVRMFGVIFMLHAVQHFYSYPLLGSQSYFSNPKPEWLLLGLLQMFVGILLAYKPRPWHSILAAIVQFLWCVAYPVGLHIGDSACILSLLGLAVVQLAGDNWIPLATLPGVVGIYMAGLWKVQGNNFSVCDLTRYIIVRYPWMDGFNTWLVNHEIVARFLSDIVICIELSAPCIWLLLFIPRFWMIRSFLALLPIALLIGIGLTANLDEFPWVMIATWLLMLGPKEPTEREQLSIAFYPLVFILYVAAFFNLEINLREMYFKGNEYSFSEGIEILPHNRVKQVFISTFAPYWTMYTGPIRHNQLFGGESNRMLCLQNRIRLGKGCGTELNRWERFFWEGIGAALNDPKRYRDARNLVRRYQLLKGQPCSFIEFPAPFPKTVKTYVTRDPSATGTWSITAHIQIGGEGDWDYLLIQPDASRLFVSHATQVVVVDLIKKSIIGSIEAKGPHGVALAPELKCGFISNGNDNSVTVFNLNTLQVVAKLPVGKEPDAICYEPKTRKIFAFNAGSRTATVIDAVSKKVVGEIPLQGDPEFAQTDGRGHVFDALEDKSVVVKINAATQVIDACWTLSKGTKPSAMAIDQAGQRLFVGCRDQSMVVMNCTSGKVIATLPIGKGVDACSYDPVGHRAFASCGDGTMTVVQQGPSDTYSVSDTALTELHARTMAFDPTTGIAYLPTAEFGPVPFPTADNPKPLPSILPDSFEILVMTHKS